jgi:ribA/ribD-fused uncharacterized protein
MLFGWDHPRLNAAALPDPAGFRTFHPFIRGVFSQWHHTPFELQSIRFVTAEQWMMYAKARLFGDHACADRILATDDPATQKRLGTQVRGFEQVAWDDWKLDIVHQGNRAKFEQNPGAARQLRVTGEAMLVEANPRDWIWGVGLAMGDPRLDDPAEWRGTNFLGRILTAIRRELG